MVRVVRLKDVPASSWLLPITRSMRNDDIPAALIGISCSPMPMR